MTLNQLNNSKIQNSLGGSKSDGQTELQAVGQTDGRTDGWMDGWIEIEIERSRPCLLKLWVG